LLAQREEGRGTYATLKKSPKGGRRGKAQSLKTRGAPLKRKYVFLGGRWRGKQGKKKKNPSHPGREKFYLPSPTSEYDHPPSKEWRRDSTPSEGST